MLFKPEDLVTESYDPIQEAADILNESVYLDESESLLSPVAIPVVENARIGANVVAFADVERLAEDHGVDYIDAMVGIAEANGIEMDKLAVSVPEWKIIANPEVVNELSNVIVAPISSQNPVYQFCEACVELALDEDNEEYINLFVEEILDEGSIEYVRQPDGTMKKVEHASTDLQATRNKAAATLVSTDGRTKEHKEAQKTLKDNQNPGDGYKRLTKRQMRARGKKMTAENLNDVKTLGDVKPDTELSRVQKIIKAVKESWPARKISEAISSLKKKYTDLKNKIQNTAPEKRSIFQKVMNLIISAIDKLTGWLSKKDDKDSNAEGKSA